MRAIRIALAAIAAALLSFAPTAQAQISLEDINTRVEAELPRVVAWRRDIHAHPELANRETRTAALVAAHLRRLGMDVRTGVAHTGVVGILHGGRPGPVVALRAEMDALPVLEDTGLPFASHAHSTYQGQDVPVAHACGHDLHVSMLMGAAEILAGMKADIPGTIVFIFQPAEEGPPLDEQGGASLMIAEGALDNPHPAAIFGMHVVPGVAGTMWYKPEGFMAASDRFDITLTGKQTHGAWPWLGIDVISLQAAIVTEFNRLAARTVDVTRTPTVLTVANVHGGVRYNIIPDSVTISGTLRTFDQTQRLQVQERAANIVSSLAATYGATATINFKENTAVTFNDPALSAWAAPVMAEAAGEANLNPAARPTMVAEDFSYYQERIPGLFVHLGASPDGEDPALSAPNHSPKFNPNERVLPLGVRAHVLFALRFLETGGPER